MTPTVRATHGFALDVKGYMALHELRSEAFTAWPFVIVECLIFWRWIPDPLGAGIISSDWYG